MSPRSSRLVLRKGRFKSVSLQRETEHHILILSVPAILIMTISSQVELQKETYA